MKWLINELMPGDHIRVKREYYYHHGVYAGNDEVIHFTGPDSDSVSNPEEVSVMKTSIEFFARNGIVEKASLSFREKFYKRKTDDILKIAFSSIGNRGYDFLHNNCEDFANKCCYKKSLSSQINDIKKNI